MRKLYLCPYCQSEQIHFDGYEDGGGDYGDEVTKVYMCRDCGMSSPEDEAFWGYEIDDDDESDDEPGQTGNHDLWSVGGGHDQ